MMPQVFTASVRTKTTQNANGGSAKNGEKCTTVAVPIHYDFHGKRETKNSKGVSLSFPTVNVKMSKNLREVEIQTEEESCEAYANTNNNLSKTLQSQKVSSPSSASSSSPPTTEAEQPEFKTMEECRNQNCNNSNTSKNIPVIIGNNRAPEMDTVAVETSDSVNIKAGNDNTNNSNALIIIPCEDAQGQLHQGENERKTTKEEEDQAETQTQRQGDESPAVSAAATEEHQGSSPTAKVEENKQGKTKPSSKEVVNFGESKSSEVTFTDPRQSQVFEMLTNVQKLRKEEKYTDLTVKVQDAKFRCHRFILAANSPFLKALVDDYSLNDSLEDDEENAKDDNKEFNHSSHARDLYQTSQDGITPKKKREAEPDGNGPKTPGDSGDSKTETLHDKGVSEIKATDGNISDTTLEESGKTPYSIILKGVRASVFSKMLDFMYCVFDDVVNEDNALEMLLASDTFQLPHLRRTCASFITETLSAKNVFEVIRLCDSGYANLFEARIMRKAHQVIRENILELSSSDDFLSLGRHLMIPLVADSMLQVKNELEVLHALLKWVRFRPEERSSDMTLMLQHIRFPLMSLRELDKLREVPLLRENSLAMALIEESRAYGNMDYNERMAWPRHNCLSRCLFPTRDFIIWTADRDKGIHFYSVIDGQHHKVTSFGELAVSTSGSFTFDSTSSACCYGDKIFFSGGEFNTDMVWSVDTSTGELKAHAKLLRGRKFHSMVASRGLVYCLGGQDKRGYSVLEDVDAYIINKDMWVKVGHLAVPAYNMTATVSGGAIYLIGGIDHSGQPLKTIQCFVALRSGLYSAFKVEISNMPPSLLSARAVTSGLHGFIYIVCGHGEVYRFEPETSKLSHLSTLRNLSENPRVRFGLAHVGGCLVVIGGHPLGRAMREPIRSVCLDIATNTEVRDYSPVLPGDIVNTCLASKLSSNILKLFNE